MSCINGGTRYTRTALHGISLHGGTRIARAAGFIRA
jgi:hypothetical protein